jgi:RNA polymerase sigma-70 factor (ECF subfamily)
MSNGASTIADLEAHRVALMGHCYRMLGSLSDADDAVQEAFVRAWQHLDGFDRRSSLRTWLYRVATNVCLDALAARRKERERGRVRPIDGGFIGTVDDELESRPCEHWLEPVPDVLAIPSDVDPSERAVVRQSIRLAFVAALKRLPPKQRATLSTDFDREAPAALSPAQAEMVERHVAAFARHDVDAIAALLRDDAVLSMPPYTLWLQGKAAIAGWLLGRGIGCKGSRLVATAACGSAAFGQYRVADDGVGHAAWSLIVLDVDASARIASITHFLDTEAFFPRFGLPLRLPG